MYTALVPSPAPHKPGVAMHICNPNTEESEDEDHKFNVMLSYVVQSKPVWGSMRCLNKKDNQDGKSIWH